MHLRSSFFLTCLLTLSGCYRATSFRGGTLSDTGVFSFPRYHAQLQTLSLDQPAHRVFALSGLPSERMGLLFYISGGTDASRETLTRVPAELSVRLEDASTGQLCAAYGPLGTGWVLMSSSSRAAFWQRQCTDLPLRRGASYLLHVEVHPAGPTTGLYLVPTLEGGGIELP